MSEKNKTNKNQKRQWLIGLAAVVLIAVCIAAAFPGDRQSSEEPNETADIAEETVTATDAAIEEQLEAASRTFFRLDKGLQITRIGGYTGAYMEDGTDEVVSGVTMIMVENTGEEFIQYAEIDLSGEGGTAHFVLTTLFPGDTVVVLESERKAYSADQGYSNAVANHVAVFDEVPGLCEDQLELHTLDGVINVTNISGADITGDIVIYYKNAINDLYYGGITYRVRITGGLKAGEIRQIMSEHYSASNSEIIFVTCG